MGELKRDADKTEALTRIANAVEGDAAGILVGGTTFTEGDDTLIDHQVEVARRAVARQRSKHGR